MGCSASKPLPPFLPANVPRSPAPPAGLAVKTASGERATHGAVDDGGVEVNRTREEDSGEEEKKVEARREEERGAHKQDERGALSLRERETTGSTRPLPSTASQQPGYVGGGGRLGGGELDEHLLLLVGNVKGGQPATLNPQPSTLNPQPSTLNPQPSTLNPQPWTLNPQPSTINPQPSTLNPR